MKIKWFCVSVLFTLILLSLPLSLSAETVRSVPGGEVQNEAELILALGGEDVVIKKDDHLLLRFDVTLEAPLVITKGKYVLVGAGCQIIASFHDAPLLTLEGGNQTSLSLGSSDAFSNSDSLIFSGNDQTRNAPLVLIGQNCELNIYAGTVFLDVLSSSDGGALYNEGTVTMYGGRFENCRSLALGGAFFNQGELFLASGKVTTSTANLGGAVYNEGKAKLIGTEFADCHAEKGGCLFNDGELEYVSSTVSACTAGQGGAIYNRQRATLSGGQLLDCMAEEGEGGAVYNAGTLICQGTYFEGNSAKSGGTIYNTASLTITEGKIYGGSASAGGNIYQTAEAEMTLSGGTVSGGKATVGGGVFNYGSIRLTSGSINLNKATFGSGVMNRGKLTVAERGRVDFDNTVFVPITEDNRHAIILEGAPSASTIACLVPGRITENGYEASYELGATLVVGTELSKYCDRFGVQSQANEAYFINSDGTLGKPVPFYYQVWFYLALVVSFFVVVTFIVYLVRFCDRRKVYEL